VRVQVVYLPPQESRIVRLVHAVVRVRGRDDSAYPVAKGNATHLKRFFQALRAIVYFGQYVAVNINHREQETEAIKNLKIEISIMKCRLRSIAISV